MVVLRHTQSYIHKCRCLDIYPDCSGGITKSIIKIAFLKLRILKLFCIYDLVTTYLHIHVTIFLSFKSLKRFLWNPGLRYYIMYHYTVCLELFSQYYVSRDRLVYFYEYYNKSGNPYKCRTVGLQYICWFCFLVTPEVSSEKIQKVAWILCWSWAPKSNQRK